MLKPITAARLAPLPGLAHGFFTRLGGVSRGVYASLNCGPGSRDDPAAVVANRDGKRPRADALVTATPGLAVSALTADCAPVLLADAKARVVAAAHAGWRGALAGILEATVAAMEGLGAKRETIAAAVGPTIGPAAYEVGWEFQDAFLARDPCSGAFFSLPAAGSRPHFNLPAYVVDRLRRIGVGIAAEPMPCTFAQEDVLFSYRRSSRHNDDDYGRQISAIVLT
jgi:polyphenol oxidase